jgi:hypothetical protein
MAWKVYSMTFPFLYLHEGSFERAYKGDYSFLAVMSNRNRINPGKPSGAMGPSRPSIAVYMVHGELRLPGDYRFLSPLLDSLSDKPGVRQREKAPSELRFLKTARDLNSLAVSGG